MQSRLRCRKCPRAEGETVAGWDVSVDGQMDVGMGWWEGKYWVTKYYIVWSCMKLLVIVAIKRIPQPNILWYVSSGWAVQILRLIKLLLGLKWLKGYEECPGPWASWDLAGRVWVERHQQLAGPHPVGCQNLFTASVPRWETWCDFNREGPCDIIGKWLTYFLAMLSVARNTGKLRDAVRTTYFREFAMNLWSLLFAALMIFRKKWTCVSWETDFLQKFLVY